MRKEYVKPEIIILELKPEEKLAYCIYPIGFWSGSTCVYSWIEYPGYQQMCESLADPSTGTS